MHLNVIRTRCARSGDNPPMIVTIPKKLVEAIKLKDGESLRIYTDSERLYIDDLKNLQYDNNNE